MGDEAGTAGTGERQERIDRLRRRVEAVLSEPPGRQTPRLFSPYVDDSTDVIDRLWEAGSAEGLQGVEAAIGEAERLMESDDPDRVRFALMAFLTQHPEAARLGIRVPSLERRAPWKTLPSADAPGPGSRESRSGTDRSGH